MSAAPFLFSLLLFVGSFAAHAETTDFTLDDLLKQVQQDRFQKNKEYTARERQFAAKKSQQARLLARARRELKRLETRAKKLENVYNENEAQITKLNQQLNKKLGLFTEMFGVLKLAASETQAQVAASLISGEQPGRGDLLLPLIKTKRIPTPAQVKILWRVMISELIAQGQVSTFTAHLLGASGKATPAQITRLGPFVALHRGTYLGFEKEMFHTLDRQPAARFLSAAEAAQAAPTTQNETTSGVITSAAIDPARGGILNLLVATPSLLERAALGGWIGYVIIALAVFGLGLGGWRLFVLFQVLRAVVAQAANLHQLEPHNPLGRVLSAHSGDTDTGETLELGLVERRLDEALLREQPELEKNLPLIKILAAIAPLLGLLGTVTGMILTFQTITLFGTGDVKLMAGGISQALITTALGLIAAVPLILLHALAAARARAVRQVLEEEVAAFLVRQKGIK